MICFPNAKINIGLSVVNKRADGYHDLETIFYPIDWCDSLEIIENNENDCRFYQSGIIIDGDSENNLVLKAYRKLKKQFDLPPVDIFLHKTIPFGAGLGGGSSDASFTLKLLRDKFILPLDNNELLSIASQLGADCPFFIENKTVFASATGNEFTKIDFSLKGYNIAVVKPSFGVSTKEAFGNIKPQKPKTSVMEAVNHPIENWMEFLKNDFETTVFKLYPGLEKIKQTLYNNGALYSAMSGSGSAVFGIFNEIPNLENVFPDCTLWQGECSI
ncbi:MAG: 4-(cytidine 5'-diphospho)-2-C-methyl-D-erythritol kinase [Bacteroidales bacterium]|nr:4-(cytidine 5'-diphospho)-2-C-methyl-D-erythritol kinase [Bacteroidales bacterium]